MYNIGHYLITYTGTSWLSAQLQQDEHHRAFVYSWARVYEDSVTSSSHYRQPVPNLGLSVLARRATLALAVIWERLGHGTTRAITARMEQDNIHLLHAHFGRAGYYALPIVKRLNIPLVTTFYGYDVSEYPARYPVWRKYYQELFVSVGSVLCLGARMRSNLIELGCPPEKACIHHLGVNLQKIQYRARHWHPGEPLRILIASAFRERKGIPYALEALGQFQHELPIEVTIIGDAPDHPDGPREKKKIMAALEQQHLQPVVRMLGSQPYNVLLEEAYQHHIFMGSSITASDGDMEGTPMVLVDVAATGMPIISTTHSDIPEIIEHGKTGWLAAERDSQGLLEYLRWYAGHPDQWETFTLAGRQHVEAEFDQIMQNRRLSQLYDELIEAKR